MTAGFIALVVGSIVSAVASGLLGTGPLTWPVFVLSIVALHSLFISLFMLMGESEIEDGVKSVVIIVMSCVLAWTPKNPVPAVAVAVASSVISASVANFWARRST